MSSAADCRLWERNTIRTVPGLSYNCIGVLWNKKKPIKCLRLYFVRYFQIWKVMFKVHFRKPVTTSRDAIYLRHC